MSRENRVNPGTYTQAGRLTPDDAAREMAKQRQSASNGHDKNPKSRATAWMNQAEQARERTITPALTSSGWVDRLGGSLALIGVALGTVCLSMYLMRRRSTARASSDSADQSPATNHTPGRPYAYGV
jgi:hypothetical protein